MIPPEADAILETTDQPRVAVRKATFVGVVDKAAQVDMGDSRFLCDFGSGYIPVVGEAVRIWSVGDQHMLFPAGPRPNVGTVSTVANNRASIATSVGTITAFYAGVAPSSGDRVGIVWSEDGPWCSTRLSSSPPPPEPPPNPGGGGGVRSAIFRVTDTGSTDRNRARWWTSRPMASSSTYGAFFYGTQIRDTIPDNATLVKLEFYVSWQQRQGGTPNFALHNLARKAGVPSMGSSTAWAPGGGWQTPPMAAAWFNGLKGGGMYGIGLNQGGWNIFSSRADNSMTGALRITWLT